MPHAMSSPNSVMSPIGNRNIRIRFICISAYEASTSVSHAASDRAAGASCPVSLESQGVEASCFSLLGL